MPYVFSLLVLALMVFALIDIITRDQSQVKHMPKFVWLILVILLPMLGSILWFAIGREYPEGGISFGQARTRTARQDYPRREEAPPAPPLPRDTRTTEQQIADLDREIEEWRLREELNKRRQQERGETEQG